MKRMGGRRIFEGYTIYIKRMGGGLRDALSILSQEDGGAGGETDF